MSEEILAGVDPAPEQVETAAPETEVVTPEDKPIVESKTFSQEDLDAAIGKRLAREQRKWERDQAAKFAEMQMRQSLPANLPPAEQFESPEAYEKERVYQKALELISQQEQSKHRALITDAYHEREEQARDKYDDFEQVAYNPKIPITEVMAEAIQSSDNGPDVAYYLGTNVKEASRIAGLSPILQAREIGKIEAKLSADPVVKRTSSAPAPISPVNARASKTSSYDTTDPRSTKTMSDSEWINAERARQIKKLQAKQY